MDGFALTGACPVAAQDASAKGAPEDGRLLEMLRMSCPTSSCGEADAAEDSDGSPKSQLICLRCYRDPVSFLLRCVGVLTSPPVTVACTRLFQRVKDRDRSAGPSRVEDAHNILVLRADGVGDVVMTGPFLRELRRARPHARITLVVAPRALNLVQPCPYVDRVLTVRNRRRMRWWTLGGVR